MGAKGQQVNISINRFPEHSISSSGQLPVTAEEALSIYLRGLNLRLKDLLDNADDHFFDKSGKSEDSRHFSAMRTLRVKKDVLINLFKQDIINQFRESIGKFDDSEFRDTRNVERLPSINSPSDNPTLEGLSLVDKDELEEQIAIDSMVSNARNSNIVALTHLRQRLDVLLPNKIITDKTNPFEPSNICSAFSSGLKPIELDVEFQLVLYKYFERNVIKELDFIYLEVNNYFKDRGVLPELKDLPIKREPRKYKTVNEVQIDEQPATDNSSEILNVLGELLAVKRGASSAQVPQQVATNELVEVLSNIQVAPVDGETQSLADVRSQITSQLPRQIAADVSNGVLGQFNDDMIDVVTMLFDFILDDENLHAEIKAIISRLQIPILKVGLVDRTFFSNRKHSARLLLNELARAGLSWDKDDRGSHPMLEKIQSVVENICSNFKDKTEIFEEILNDFLAFKAEFQKRAKIFERRTREAEEGKAKAESAKGKVNYELKRICYKKNVPEVVKRLFKNVWVQVMFLESLRADEDAWDRVCKVAKMLVWSVQPVKNKEQLQRLTRTIPVVIKNLNLGFKKVALSNLESSGLLDKLEDTHRHIIKLGKETIDKDSKETILRLPPKPAVMEPSKIETTSKEEIELSDQSEEPIEEVIIEDIAFTQAEIGGISHEKYSKIKIEKQSKEIVNNLNSGSWIEFKNDTEVTRCKLAAKIISTQKFIFVNRAGAKVADFYADELAAEYQMGNLRVLDDEALFDRALESVISNLRTMKTD